MSDNVLLFIIIIYEIILVINYINTLVYIKLYFICSPTLDNISHLALTLNSGIFF